MPDAAPGPRGRPRLDDIADLFAEAIEMEDPQQRVALIATLRTQDPARADTLTALLEAHFADPDFLTDPIADTITDVLKEQMEATLVGHRVGSWEVESVLHHGGMGTVYRARRTAVDFEQHAALKVIRMGLDSPELIRRFAQERRLLARLEHPNIARLLDGGTTPEGLPWLVMEQVHGEMIDVWCARERPSIDRLLGVFAQICSAVNLAHQNLVVHQDIKPSNILVTPDGTAKLLDFGIAELERQATSESETTAPEGRMLTPDYASPEQYRGDSAGTATDTYALGVLLYRLLTGDTPYHVRPGSTPAEAERQILETSLIPPSAALAAQGAPRPRRAADLDAIVLRALRIDPVERHPSVLAFADDLRRYTEGAPVHARPATLGYRLTRFIGRNRAALGAAATIVVLLVAGLSTALWQAGVAARQRDLARAEASTAASAVTFLKTVLGSADPWRDTEPAESVDDVIRLAETTLDTVLRDEPAARAYILAALGEVAAGRGELERADRLTSAAVMVLETSADMGSARAGAIHLARALALHEDGRLQEARTFAVEAVRRLETRDADTWQYLAGALNQLAALDVDLGDHLAAEASLRRAVTLYQANGGGEMLGLATVYNNLAVALTAQPDRLEEVATIYTDAARIIERTGASAPQLATLLVNQANLLRLLGRHDESEATFTRAIALMTNALGPDHQSTLTASASLASLYEASGRFEQAATTLRAPLATALATLPPDHPTTAYLQNVLSAALCQIDGTATLAEGLTIARASFDTRRAALGESHWAVASAESIVGHCLARLGRRTAGVPLLQRAVATLQSQRGDDHELTVRARRWLEQAH